MSLRIVSLIASATEIVCELGFEKQIVGRSHECDFPHSVLDLVPCTKPKFDTTVSSREIDHQVKDVLKNSLAVYSVNDEIIKSLKPTHIITQAQCEVCAVSLKDVELMVQDWTGTDTKVISLQPDSLEHIWADISLVSKSLGAKEEGSALISRLKNRMEKIKSQSSSLNKRPKIACIEWIDPLMSAGNWIPELVEMAGGNNLLGEAGKHSPWMSLENLVQSDPDKIIIMPCGFDIPRIKKEMTPLTTSVEFTKLRAVRNNEVYITDGNQYFNRPGPRVVESLEIFAEIFHPSNFNFDFEGSGWQKYSFN